MTADELVTLAEQHGAEVGRYEGAACWIKLQPRAIEALSAVMASGNQRSHVICLCPECTAPSHPVGSALTEIIRELRWYNPAADAYKGQYIHKGWADRIEAALAALVAPEPAKPLDDPRLQQLFGDAIEGALAFGYQGNNRPPEGHWLWRFWNIGHAESPASQPAEAVSETAKQWANEIASLARPPYFNKVRDAILFIAGTQAAAEPDTETMVAEVAAALEVVRARHIVEEVQSLDIGGKDADMPTQFQAGYQLACEEILTRIGGAQAAAEPATSIEQRGKFVVRGVYHNGRHFSAGFDCASDRDDWLEREGFENIAEFKCSEAK